MKEIIEEINLSFTLLLSYFRINIPLGYIIFFSWFFKKLYKICTLKIFIPQAVDPAHPPINIRIKKKISGKLPHVSKSWATYPVPVNIETTLEPSKLLGTYLVFYVKKK